MPGQGRGRRNCCPSLVQVVGFVAAMEFRRFTKGGVGSDLWHALTINLLLPCCRELVGQLVKANTDAMLRPLDLRTGDLVGQPWPFVMWSYQTFALLLRLLVTEFDFGLQVLVVGLQMVLEIGFRCTHRWRSAKARAAWRALKLRARRACAACPLPCRGPAPLSPVSELGAAAGAAAAAAHWHEMGLDDRFGIDLFAHTISEYAAILSVHLLLVFWRGAPLVLPLVYYSHLENPFDEPPPLQPILSSLALQLGFELATDLLVFVGIARFWDFDLCALWRRVPKGACALWLAWSSLFAHSAALQFIPRDYPFRACRDRDVCACHGEFGGLVPRYCRAVYPDSDGYPPSADAAAPTATPPAAPTATPPAAPTTTPPAAPTATPPAAPTATPPAAPTATPPAAPATS